MAEPLLDVFVNANILICIAFLMWVGLRRILSALGFSRAYGAQLRLLNAVFLAIVAAPLIASGYDKLRQSRIVEGLNVNLSDQAVSYYLQGGFQMRAADFEALILARDTLMLNVMSGQGWLAQALVLIVLVGLVIGTARLIYAVACLRSILSGSYLWRRAGRVQIHLSDRVLVPFSTRGLYRYYVVLPSRMLGHPDELTVSVAHEFQHIRQGDLNWEVLLETLKPLFFFNPAFHAWKRAVDDLRELSCDATVLSRGRIAARTYCETLLSVCQTTLNRHRTFAAAQPKVTLVSAGAPSFLERRIRSLLQPRLAHERWVFSAAVVPLVTAVLLAGLAIQPPGDWSHDRLMLSTVVNLERMDEINGLYRP